MADNRMKLSSPVLGCGDVRPGNKLIMLLICSVMSGVIVAGFGGVLFILAAAGILAFAMCSGVGIIPVLLCGGLSLGLGVLLGAELPVALVTLLYIPMALVMRICIGRRKGLYFTVSAMTVTLIFIGAATLGIMYLADGSYTREMLSSLYNAYRDYITEYVSALYAARELPVSKTVLDAFLEVVVMVTPSVIIVMLEIFSYISAKICRLAAGISDSVSIFEGNRWPVVAPLGATLIFAVCFALSLFSNNAVVMYSASNLMMIFFPGCAVYGMNLLFGRRRRKTGGIGRIFLILLCIISIYTGGVILFTVAAFYAVLCNIRAWLVSLLKKFGEEE